MVKMINKKSTLVCIMLSIFLVSISLGCSGPKEGSKENISAAPEESVTSASVQSAISAPQSNATNVSQQTAISTEKSNSKLNVTISSPLNGSSVSVSERIIGNSTGVYETGLHLYVLINPVETGDEWWVQPEAKVSPDGKWFVNGNFGNPGNNDTGKQYWMTAIVTSNTLNVEKGNYTSGEYSTEFIQLTRK